MMMNLCPARGGGRCLALALFLLIVPHASADLIKFTIGANANEVAAGDGTIRAGTGGLSRVITVTQGETAGQVAFRLWQAIGGDIMGNMVSINARTGGLIATGGLFPGGVRHTRMIMPVAPPPNPGQPPQMPAPVPNPPPAPDGSFCNFLLAPGGVLPSAGTLTKTITTSGGTINVIVPFTAGMLISDVHNLAFGQMMLQAGMLPSGVTLGRLADGTPALFGSVDFDADFFDQMTLAGGGIIPDSVLGSYAQQVPAPGASTAAAVMALAFAARRRRARAQR